MAEYIQPVRTMTESNSIAPGQDSIDVNPDHGGTPDKRTEYEMGVSINIKRVRESAG